MSAAWAAKRAGHSIEEARELIAAKMTREPQPDEIENAVSKAYNTESQTSYPPSIKENFSPETLEKIASRLDGFGRADLLERSPVKPDSFTPARFLMHLFKPGERVRLVSTGGTVRVTH